MMSIGLVFLLMILAHIIEDFHLQGKMADMKQKVWWQPYGEKYRNDYLMALFLHGMEWSICVSLPLLLITGLNVGTWFIAMVFMNGIIHSLIDDMKANMLRIDLITDQSLHIVQMAEMLLITVVLA